MIDISRPELERSLRIASLVDFVATQPSVQEGGNLTVLTTRPDRPMKDISNVLVAYGSFDPITTAHAAMIQQAESALQKPSGLVELLMLVPVKHVEKTVDVTKNAAIPERVRMLERWVDGSAAVGVSGTSLFVDLLPQIKRMYGGYVDVHAVMGADVLLKVADPVFYPTKSFPEVLEKLFEHSFLLCPRDVAQSDGSRKRIGLAEVLQARPVLQGHSTRITELSHGSGVSSTAVRQTILGGRSASTYLPRGMQSFISARHIYESNDYYPAFCAARSEFMEAHRQMGAPIETYVDHLHGYIQELNADASTRSFIIAARDKK